MACGSGDNAASPTEQASGTPPADATAIRDLNLTQEKNVTAQLAKIGGGQVEDREITYADLTGDQREEAIVPISSGGTMGNVAYLVLTPSDGGVTVLLTRNTDPRSVSGLRMAVEDGILVEYVGEYGPEDPMCCPSVLRRTTFKWDGSKLEAQGEERIQRGPGKQ
jgi:hypothetical protein